MTNPEELQRRFEGPSSRMLITVLGILAAAALVVGLTARPVWSLVKASRARHFLDEAERLLAEKQYVLAFERGRSALQLAPSSLDALRFNAQILGILRGEASLAFWQRLMESGMATDEDKASYVERALTMDRADLVQDIVPEIVDAKPSTPRSDRIAALYCLQVGRLSDALQRAREARELEPGNPTNALLLADILATVGKPVSIEEARPLYWEVARTNAGLRLYALRKLSHPPFALRSDREQLVELLDAGSDRSATEEILLAENKLQLDPSQSARIISNLIVSLPRDDLERLSATADTLERLGRHNEVLHITAGGRDMGTRELFLARYRALAATGQFEEAYRMTLQRNAPLSPFNLEMLRAEAAQKTGDPRRRETHLQELLRAAGVHPARLRTACELAEALDSPQIAAQGWRLLSQQPPEAVNALRQLQRIADHAGDTWTARDHARRAVRIGATEPDLRLEVAYYDLLLDDDPDRGLSEAQRELDRKPDDFFARAVVALGHLRLGDARKARAVLDRFIIDQASLRPDALAVVVAVYGANGLSSRAIELAGKLPIARLRPEERELIRPWLIAQPPNAALSVGRSP